MSKKTNPFVFGQRVLVPNTRSGARMITEIVDAEHIRVLDIVEITDRQRADWLRTPIKGELKFVPGMVVSTEGVEDWDAYMAKSFKPFGA
jgi:hypothetical protein